MEIQVLHFFFLLGLVAVTQAADPGVHGGSPGEYEYSPYHYEYNVDDDKEYLHFGQEEEDDGSGNVHGYYHVQLPDGRLQRVDYHVSGYSGYIADVKYDGEAQHPSNAHHGGSGHLGGHQNSGNLGGHHTSVLLGGHQNSGHLGGHHTSGLLGGHYSGHLGGLHHSGNLGGHLSSGHLVGHHTNSVNLGGHHTIPSPENIGGHHISGHLGGHHTSGDLSGSSRLGKAVSVEQSPVQTQKSSLITRKRIESPETLEFASSEQVNTVQNPTNFFTGASPVDAGSSVPSAPIKPVFEFRNAHNQIQTFKQAHQEAKDLRKSQQIIGNIQHIPQEVQDLQNAQRQIQDLQRVQHETQGLLRAQHKIQTLQNIQHETQAIQNGQRQIQNIQQNEQKEFQEHQNALIRDPQQAEVIQRKHQHRRFPSLIKHSEFDPPAGPVTSQLGFSEHSLRGRVIQTP